MNCYVCHAALAHYDSACPNCGEPAPPVLSPGEAPAHYARQIADHNGLTEARALEYAGDPESAIAIYEELAARGIQWNLIYRRLAIIYKNGKRRADEERIVRRALAVFPNDAASWFVLRLATIIAKQKKAAQALPPVTAERKEPRRPQG